jgi:HAD superfamily hydrolase (TIGR01509 family)
VLAPGSIEALVFDLDGTIVDTETPEFESIRAVWSDHGADYTIAQFEHCIGIANGIETWLDDLVDLVGYDIDRTVADERRRGVHRALTAALQPRDGIVALLDEAASLGVGMAVASNSPEWWVRARLEALGLDHHFGALVTLDRSSRPKPHPAPFLEACAAIGADPACSVAFEDSATGVASARAAGLYTIACPGPLTANHDLRAAHRVIASHTEIRLSDLTLVH